MQAFASSPSQRCRTLLSLCPLASCERLHCLLACWWLLEIVHSVFKLILHSSSYFPAIAYGTASMVIPTILQRVSSSTALITPLITTINFEVFINLPLSVVLTRP
ncbi:uncharacterized protein BO80DRAFT_204952 [Aspergillus ibericus CBS 121593]|uniref:Uncharacterized protein n=1 Tax=Aspergillus ibericus CBS 121593 TaxID=1448316 RepID=A0A395HCE3_9EURO|nr:hypothetical protein BO80DRAFT_204952 [Aspergillus ibericus CBS 121593]RAL04628.1 hypothetical protein BO80DRAFT_204952 [Aspergillus ibericus CBS 121593]